MRILAFDTSTDWLSVAAGDGTAWHARAGARGPGAFGAHAAARSTPCSRERGWRARGPRRHRVRRRPRLVHRRAHRLRRRAGPGVRRRSCRSSPVPTLEALAQAAWRARGMRRACSRASTRGCARSMSPRIVRDGDGVARRARAGGRCSPDEASLPDGERLARRGRRLRGLSGARVAAGLSRRRRRCASRRARDRRARAAAARRGRGGRAPTTRCRCTCAIASR